MLSSLCLKKFLFLLTWGCIDMAGYVYFSIPPHTGIPKRTGYVAILFPRHLGTCETAWVMYPRPLISTHPCSVPGGAGELSLWPYSPGNVRIPLCYAGYCSRGQGRGSLFFICSCTWNLETVVACGLFDSSLLWGPKTTRAMGGCLPGARPAHAGRATLVLSILFLAPGLSSP